MKAQSSVPSTQSHIIKILLPLHRTRRNYLDLAYRDIHSRESLVHASCTEFNERCSALAGLQDRYQQPRWGHHDACDGRAINASVCTRLPSLLLPKVRFVPHPWISVVSWEVLLCFCRPYAQSLPSFLISLPPLGFFCTSLERIW